MTKWTFEPGHTAAEFSVRHMMVTWVRGSFKNVQGSLDFDPNNPEATTLSVTMDAKSVWSGDEARDKHLRTADFLDVENHPTITFKSTKVEKVDDKNFKITGDFTLRGVTKEVVLDTTYNGQWMTPFWVDGKDEGPVPRLGFVATTKINRQDFGVKWNGPLENNGIVVGNDIHITIDAEALPAKE